MLEFKPGQGANRRPPPPVPPPAARPGLLLLGQHRFHVLVRAGNVAEAILLLDGVATSCARAGMPGRAIAALKKLAHVDPTALPAAGKRIAALAKQRDHEVAQASLSRGPSPVRPARPAEHGAVRRPAGASGLAAGEPDRSYGEPGTGYGATPPASRSPLFSDFSADELAAVIHGLDLRSFAPGDLVVSQGEPGRSLFVVASGTVKVWVREGEGRGRFVRSLGEGDFFGEVSLLTGRPRTATVTAATRADLLELGWSRVEEIVRDHPRVADVLRAFCDERLKADLAARAAGEPSGQADPAEP